MTIILELPPELEAKALAAAKVKGVPVEDIVQQALRQMPAPSAPPETDTEGPTLWERSKDFLEAMWAEQPDGPTTYYSELEEACDVPEDNAPTLFDRIQGAFQPFWDAEKNGQMTNYSDLEEACDTPEEDNA